MGHGLQADVPVSSDCIPGSRPKISRRMYLRSFTNRHPEPSFILHWRCDFSSYKRNAVLMTMQKAKLSLARQRHPTARDNRFGNPLANRLTLAYWKSKGEALSATRSRAAVMTGLRESQLACRASRCSESSALPTAFSERRTASNTASGEISLMHLRPVRHTPL